MHIRLVIAFFCFQCLNLSAQQVYYPVESWQSYEAYRTIFRGFGSSFGDPQTNRFGRILYTDTSKNTIDEIQVAATDKPLFKHFYKQKDAFFKVQEYGKYVLIVNPVLHFNGGKDDSSTLYRNTRGIELAGNIGGIDKGIGFYSLLTENQEMYPHPYRYFTDSLNHVPNEFFYKFFKKDGAVDYFQARGYITFNAAKNYVKFQFGHDKHKIGNGYRSLILSDFAPQYLFLKINTDIKRFHYQNLITQFTDNGPILSNILYGKKYAAMHRLSFDITPRINIGINEMVIFDRMDSTQSNQFDFNYLNPVIFYRSIESNLGSRDNSLMALDLHWRIRNKYAVYGQFLLDEFNLKFLKNEPNWWANKYGYQIGIRAFDLLKVQNLDVLMEYNRMRPYAYSHKRPTQSYSHFNQALAHPLGANFSEGILDVKYKLKNKWFLNTTLIYAITGTDSFLNGRNYGNNILRSYDTRTTEYDSKMFMGNKRSLMVYNLQLSYMLRYNLFLDTRVNYRKYGDAQNLFFSLGIRLNAESRRLDY